MNPKQLRGVITLIIAAVGAIIVFLGVTSYVSEVRAEVGPVSEVYVVTEDVSVHQSIDFEIVEAREIPDKYRSPQMVTSQEELVGTKASAPIHADSYLQNDMLEPASSLEDGEREIAVNFAGDMGIHGRVQPGDRVDVVASFARDRGGPEIGDVSHRRADIPFNVSGVLVRDAEVVSVGQATADPAAAAGAASEGTGDPGMVVPVTFAVSIAEANQLAYGESFAISMRIIRSGNNETGSAIDEDDLSFQDPDLGPNFYNDGSEAPPADDDDVDAEQDDGEDED